MSKNYAPWPDVIILSSIIAAITNFGNMNSFIRPIIGFWFLFVIPGMSFIKILELKNIVYEWTLAIALSFALDTIVAGIFIYADIWNPNVVLTVLIMISLIGATLQVLLDSNIQSKKLSPPTSEKLINTGGD